MTPQTPPEPRTYRLFVSSPSDVDEERDRVHAVAAGLNRSFERVELEVLDWRRRVAPGLGAPAHEIVDADMDDPYDVYIGIMWSKLGTPAGDAPSGTIHEFRQASERQRSGQRIRIMFYFSQKAVPPALGDQMGGVNDFRRQIERQGLVGEFNDADHFEQVLRRDLNLVIGKLIEADRTALGARQSDKPEGEVPDEEEEQGADLIDLRLRLEAKLTWLCKQLFGTPQAPTYATIGSLKVDGYLTEEQARVATRVMTGDAGTTRAGDPAERARFREEAEQVVTAFRAVVFAARVRELATDSGADPQEFDQAPGHRPDFLVRNDGALLRVAPRFSLGSSTRLVDNTLRRLARRADEPDGVTRRLVVVPGDREAAGGDPTVLGLPQFIRLLKE